MTNLAHDYSWLPQPPPRRHPLMPGEVAVFRARPEQSAAQWAQGERHIEVSPTPGPYDSDVTPYLTGLLELYSLEHLRDLFLAGGSQSAKTDFMHTTWGYDAVFNPGPALIAMQDRDTGAETLTDRLVPMIHGTPSLRRVTTGRDDDISSRRIRLRTGMVTYLAWAQSEGRLASKPIRYLKADEVDLWPEASVRKARARLRAFNDSYKAIEACTVSTEQGRIWQAQKLAEACIDFWPICPHCGEAHVMNPANVAWDPEVVDPAQLRGKRAAWYICPHCRKEWDEEDRNEAVRLAEKQHNPPHVWHGWRAREGSVDIDKATSVWAHIPPLISRFVPFVQIARAYLTTLTEPTEANLQYYYNDCCGLPLPEDTEGELTTEKELYNRRADYWPKGADWRLPMAALVLTSYTDVQKDRLETEVVAWGEGKQSWGVEYQVFHGDTSQDDVWDQLHDYLQDSTWRHETGLDLKIARSGVDINYRTDQASLFVKRSRTYLAGIGGHVRGLPLVPRKPGKTKKYKVPFYAIGTETGKDTLFSWLTVEVGGPRCCHWHTGQGYDFEYFRMLCSERPKRQRNKKTGKQETVWALREGFVRNEALDIRVGNMAVLEILNPNFAKLAAYIAEQAIQLAAQEQDLPPIALARPKKQKRSFTVSKGVSLDD